MTARHGFEEHTSEIAIRVVATTPAELFEEAGRAIAEVMNGGRAPSGPPVSSARVSVAAADRDALLVEWLNELVFQAETTRSLPVDVRVASVGDRALEAVVGAVPSPEFRTVVKAATLHGVHVAEGPEGLGATVVVDV